MVEQEISQRRGPLSHLVSSVSPWKRCLSLPGPPGLHSATLDLDGDVRASVPGHLGQTASLKRGSSFQPGRDDGECLPPTCIF